jgi:MOSC domain-containing protein YiiM
MKICHLYISPGHSYFGRHGQPAGDHPIVEVAEIECVAGCGVKGDRFFNFKENYKGQITFFSWETFQEMCVALNLSGKSPAAARRNVVTEGADLNSLIGTEFDIQGVRFRGMAHCKPCYWMDQAFAPGAEQFLQNCGGLRAQILTTGRVCVESSLHLRSSRRSRHVGTTNSCPGRTVSLAMQSVQPLADNSPSPCGRGPG